MTSPAGEKRSGYGGLSAAEIRRQEKLYASGAVPAVQGGTPVGEGLLDPTQGGKKGQRRHSGGYGAAAQTREQPLDLRPIDEDLKPREKKTIIGRLKKLLDAPRRAPAQTSYFDSKTGLTLRYPLGQEPAQKGEPIVIKHLRKKVKDFTKPTLDRLEEKEVALREAIKTKASGVKKKMGQLSGKAVDYIAKRIPRVSFGRKQREKRGVGGM
jgi:hypothetical protein